MVGWHHERWDGEGYPQRLAGESIPISGRIVALADVFDALASRRVYKDSIPRVQALAMVTDQGGRHFDPALVAILNEEFDAVEEIYTTFSDE